MQIIMIMKLGGGALYDFPYSTNNQDVKALVMKTAAAGVVLETPTYIRK